MEWSYRVPSIGVSLYLWKWGGCNSADQSGGEEEGR